MAWPRITDITPQTIHEIQNILDIAEAAISGPTVLSDDQTAVSSNTLTAQAGLSRDVLTGVVYSFRIVLYIIATAGEGLQIDLAGGSAGATWIKASFSGDDSPVTAPGDPTASGSVALLARTGTLATAVGPQDAFSGRVIIEGSLQPSSDGSFAPRIAQTGHSAGSVQVLKGSSISTEASA